MGKISNDAYFLYEGFRKYVPKKKLSDYDNDFLSRKIYTVKFMVGFIDKYVNVKYYHKKLKDKNDAYLFNFYVIEFSQKYSKVNIALNEFKNTPRTIDTNFMYSNPRTFKK